MSNTVVEVSNLCKTFSHAGETLHILKDASFTAAKGSSTSITGRSGSGKTTLLNILGGLDSFDRGSVVIDGAELFGLKEKQLTEYRKTKAGFIFQFHYLLKDFTALENIMLPLLMRGEKRGGAKEKALIMLRDVQLEERAGHFPAQLSGGERQRIAVARALINDPSIILADEPTGNLDSENSALVSELLYSCAEKRGKTLIVATHDATVAGRAENRFTLQDGKLLCSNLSGLPLSLPHSLPPVKGEQD